MIWFTWRQFRTQTWFTAGALAALGVVLIVTGRDLVAAYANVAACQRNCEALAEMFLDQVRTGTNIAIYFGTLAILYVLPALVGMFWGAPVIARELETGTHQLTWNQSVTRTRWLGSKLAVLATATAVTAGLLSWAVTVWARPIDSAGWDRLTPLVYGARGIVPIGYALFAFALGVTAGMLLRLAVPAMAVTLVVFAVVAVAMPLWIRVGLVPAVDVSRPLDTSALASVGIIDNRDMYVVGEASDLGGWVASNETLTPAGQVFNGPIDPQSCGETGTRQACNEWLASLDLRQEITYHPTDHFWPLQWVETGLLTGIAVLLAVFCFWWTRHRLT